MNRARALIVFLLSSVCGLNAAEPAQVIVLRPDLPAGEEWYTPPASNEHVKSPTKNGQGK
jgi:hypothetical protein